MKYLANAGIRNLSVEGGYIIGPVHVHTKLNPKLNQVN